MIEVGLFSLGFSYSTNKADSCANRWQIIVWSNADWQWMNENVPVAVWQIFELFRESQTSNGCFVCPILSWRWRLLCNKQWYSFNALGIRIHDIGWWYNLVSKVIRIFRSKVVYDRVLISWQWKKKVILWKPIGVQGSFIHLHLSHFYFPGIHGNDFLIRDSFSCLINIADIGLDDLSQVSRQLYFLWLFAVFSLRLLASIFFMPYSVRNHNLHIMMAEYMKPKWILFPCFMESYKCSGYDCLWASSKGIFNLQLLRFGSVRTIHCDQRWKKIWMAVLSKNYKRSAFSRVLLSANKNLNITE